MGGHVAIVIDVSDSVIRDPEAFIAARDRLADVVDGLVDDLKGDGDALKWVGSITLFAGEANWFARDRSLGDLSTAIRSVRPEPIGNAGESNGAAGLRAAREMMLADRGSGLIMVMSDGLWLSGDEAAELQRLRQANIPVYTLPVGSRSPGTGITAADLSPSIEAGAPAVARLVVLGAGSDGSARVTVRRDDAAESSEVTEISGTKAAVPIRIEDRFTGRGLRHMEVALEGEGGVLQTRRLYTLVKAPPRVLVFGSAGWANRLDPEAVRIVRASTDAPLDPELYDVILIDGIRPEAFPDGYPQRLAEAVAGAGRGVFLVNGPHRGSTEKITTIGTWEETPLEPLLPVDMDPRSVVEEPPPRDIAIIVDTSGSMEGWPLEQVRVIGRRVLGLTRPVDHLKIIAFSDGHREFLPRTRMTPDGKHAADDVFKRLRASGGSYANSALESVSDMRGNSCAVFFITDGRIDDFSGKPGCWTVVFEVARQSHVINRELERLGQVIAVDQGGFRRTMRIRFLEPVPREERWRAGTFTPIAKDEAKLENPKLVPGIVTDGLAIAYPRPEAQLINVHPDAPPDPLVAFREDKNGAVGVFLSDFGGAWGPHAEGLVAMQAYIDRLAGWSETDRYLMEARDGVSGIDLELRVLAGGDTSVPRRIGARLLIDNSVPRPVRMEAVPGEWGLFQGRIPYPEGVGSDVVDGSLEIRESGEGAVTRAQRIPVRLPRSWSAKAGFTGGEIWTYGVNHDVLETVASVTGGRYLGDDERVPWQTGKQQLGTEPLHEWLLFLAAMMFVGGLMIGGAKP